MIYLIDEKKARQIDFGFDSNALDEVKNSLNVVYDLSELKSFTGEFNNPDNWFLFHDSFLDNLGHSTEDKQRLIDKSNEGAINLVLFGGSGEFNIRRKINSTSFKVPVDVLYKNLMFFLKSAKNDKPNIDDLFYGKDKEYVKLAETRFQALKYIYQIESLGKKEIPSSQANILPWFTAIILASGKEVEERNYLIKELKDYANSLLLQ